MCECTCCGNRRLLEQARVDGFVRCYCVYSRDFDIPGMSRDLTGSWGVYVSLSKKQGDVYGFYEFGATEAEAIAAAAAHVEELRKPKLPEPETMTWDQCVLEIVTRGGSIKHDPNTAPGRSYVVCADGSRTGSNGHTIEGLQTAVMHLRRKQQGGA